MKFSKSIDNYKILMLIFRNTKYFEEKGVWNMKMIKHNSITSKFHNVPTPNPPNFLFI